MKTKLDDLKIMFGRRELKEKNIENNWTNLQPQLLDTSKHMVLVFGGNTTDCAEVANGYAKNVEKLLHTKVRKSTDIYSFFYKSEFIQKTNRAMAQEYEDDMHKLFNVTIKPLLFDRVGKIKEKQGIEKVLHNITFVGHCGGCNFISLIIEDIYKTISEYYPPAVAEMLVGKIQYVAYAPNEYPLHEVNSLTINPFVDSNYSWVKLLHRMKDERVDVDFPKGTVRELFKEKNKSKPGEVFTNIFKKHKATAFKFGQSIYLIPSRMNPDISIGDHSIECITKPHILNSGTDYALSAQIANYATSLCLNNFVSSDKVSCKQTFYKIVEHISSKSKVQQDNEFGSLQNNDDSTTIFEL